MNKYSEWNMAESYPRCDLLYDHEGVLKNEVMRYSVQGKNYYHAIIYPYDYERKYLYDLLDMMIIAILSTGKYMTLSQLEAYLLLRGYEEKSETIRQRVKCMVNGGVVIGYRLFRMETGSENGGSGEEVLSVYAPTYLGSCIAKDLGAPTLRREENDAFTASMGRINAICSCVMWNQVILNQMLYNPNFVWFRVQEKISIPKKHTFCIPLRLVRKKWQYIFDFVRCFHGRRAIEEKIVMWHELSRSQNQPFILILMCENRVNEQTVSDCIIRLGPIGQICATTVDSEWFKLESGTVNYSHMRL